MDSELGKQWKEWADEFDKPAEAAREAIKAGIDGPEARYSAMQGVYAGLVMLIVLLLGAIRTLYDVQTMGIVFGVALAAFALVYAGPGLLARIRGVWHE